MEKVEEKVNRLEAAFEEFTRTVGLEFNKVYNAIMLSHINYDRISQDITQLGNRIEATRELLDNFIKESEKQRQEDRQKFNEFKDEMREEHRKMNRQWGELANKMGTIVEDIIYPATRPVLEKYFNCELETTMMNITRKKDGIKDEFDVIAVSADKVFLIEVKSTMRQQYVDDFKNKKLERFRFLFSEYNDKTLVPILATLRYGDSMLAYVTKNNIYAMAYREWDYMDILNFEDITI